MKTLKKKTKKVRKTKNIKKINKYNVHAAIFSLIVVMLLLFYYSGLSSVKPSENVQREDKITAPKTETVPQIIVTGGSCKRNSECFLTHCKGYSQNCINTVQLSTYSKNCKTYSDWVTDRQDYSKCACVQNVCKMIG